MSTILVVDDQLTSLAILERLAGSLDESSRVEAFTDPVEALKWTTWHEIDLVLVDFRMPRMDGVEFTRRFRETEGCKDVPLVVVTSFDAKDIRYRALEAGATDFLTKPVDHIEFRARCRNLLVLRGQQKIIKDRARWLERKVEEATREIRTREYETLIRLAKAGEYRDEETGNHVLRMAKYSRLIAEELGLDAEECQVVELSAPMHDIGKIGIPDHILLKPGRLTDDEVEVMRKHTLIGYEILKGSPSKYLQRGAEIALSHHERYDGGGYPCALKGEEIPLAARIVAVADVYDALTTWRPYKPAWAINKALDYVLAQRGKHFDPDCIAAFQSQFERIVSIQKTLSDDDAAKKKVGA
jgi:two-component system response regulator RpfG